MRASRSSCTSEARFGVPGRVRPSRVARLVGLVRLTHPFPSLLNGAITGGVALVAGAEPPVALRLALAMVFLQVSIGALNDLVDAPRDAGRKRGKPIPAGLVRAREGRIVALGGLIAGLALAAPSGFATLAVATAGVVSGYAYDLRLKGSAISWAPFAIGIPLLPVFAWIGATDTLPAGFAVLVPVAALAGTALAIANALADHERDRAAGTPSIAVRLGPRRAWQVHALLQVIVVAAAVAVVGPLGGSPASGLYAGLAGLVILAGALLGRRASPARRELAWEVEAVGTGLLALTWLAAVAAQGS